MAESLLTGLVCSSIVLVEHRVRHMNASGSYSRKTLTPYKPEKVYTNLGFFTAL